MLIRSVKVDFETLKHLSRVAREEYGTAGAVQHGASTLPESAFGKFPEAEACEVHLATNFQNMLYDRLPDALRDEIYAYLDTERGSGRKDGETDEQFYYNNRKYALGPFKAKIWGMDAAAKQKVADAWQAQFAQLFDLLAIAGTATYVAQTVDAAKVQPDKSFYFGEEAAGEEDVSDLSD